MMRGVRAVTILLLIASTAGCGGSSPSAPTGSSSSRSALADSYLREIIDLMKENSIYRQRIDWAAFQNQVMAKTPDAKTILDTYPAIQVALGLLGDHHSFYQNPTATGGISNPNPPSGCGVAAVADPDVPADIGYVRIASFSGSGDQVFAQNIQIAIRERDRDGVLGWIVDLRGNGGGNMWPMLAGVGPVLGTGTAGYFVAPVSAPIPWGYEPGASMLNGRVVVSASAYATVRKPNPRVAVLTDKRVASSGEAIAVAFRSRPNTRMFGTETCGLPTANSGFPLSDGATLFLTTAVEADRLMNLYDSPLPPDETITDSSALAARAIAWLRSGS